MSQVNVIGGVRVGVAVGDIVAGRHHLTGHLRQVDAVI